MNIHPTDGPIHEHFGLSYCNYQVLHRTLMQSMPIEWQERMVACLDELAAAFEHVEQPEVFDVKAATEHIVNEMGDAELKQAGIVADWFRGETPPEGLDAEDLAEWQEQHEDPEGPTYSRDGEELDGHERVLLAAVDPVPHYNRGRTYIEPKLPEPDGETPLEKRLRFSERRNDELRTECKRRGKRVLEQSERLQALEREIDEVRRQLGAEILRAGQAEAELRRLAAEAPATTDPAHAPGMPCEHGCRAAADELSREANLANTQNGEGLRCVCGDPVQLMDDNDPTSWIHSPGSDTRCLEARPRCPHCQLPHALTPSGQLMCASIRASIADHTAEAPATTEQPTPCDQPNACDPDTGELCATHEEEQAHAEGEHEFCGVTCEIAMPTELMRNSLIAWAPAGGKGILAELERRAAAAPPPAVVEPAEAATETDGEG